MAEQMMQETAGKAIPAGYKQTEVGVIPEDWDVFLIDNCAVKVGSGKTPTGGSSVYVDSGRPFVRSQNVGWGKLDLSDVAYITETVHSTFLGSEIKRDDVLLNITGASIGRCAKADIQVIGGNVNQHVCIIRVDGSKFVPVVLVELINSSVGQNQIDSFQAGGNREGLNFAQVRQLKFALPLTVVEQTAIANVLSDSDALIDALEQLIAKKQAIKSATMQQLLTGRTRLPAFALRPDGTPKGYKPSELGDIPEDWEVAPFGNLFETSISRKNLRATEVVSFVGMQDVTETAQLHNQTSITYEKVKTGFTYFECGDVLVAKITPCFENGKGCHTKSLKSDVGFGSTEFHVLRATANADSDFIYYWTTQACFRKQLESEMVGSAGHRRVPLPAIQSYMIPCSMNKKEQTAIATILSDMDNELQALTQKLEKARALKQGMMQQLLTGKIRLPLAVGA
ncbi:restriction endonuclease subunit S [Aeromonas hydrophila]|uniref:restriction endonuclease subunit S n=1 Tax=Aeromonas hydrophila TaxID=644 RepID=UPI00259DA71B|nr:restriction endonuclease subunit S [Aeromonas hydrophila]MDM5119356.1 restriction endonuclease subunit S [Aeromonas hydrophila]